MSRVGQDYVPDHVIEVLDVARGLHGMARSSLSYRLDPAGRLHKPGQVYYTEIQWAMLSHFRHASDKRKQIFDLAPAGSSST